MRRTQPEIGENSKKKKNDRLHPLFFSLVVYAITSGITLIRMPSRKTYCVLTVEIGARTYMACMKRIGFTVLRVL